LDITIYQMRTLTIISIVLFIAACSANKVAAPSKADVEKEGEEFAELAPSELASGKELYVANCGKCHAHKEVSDYTKEEWEKIMPNMVQKANGKGSNLGATDEHALLRYAVAMSK